MRLPPPAKAGGFRRKFTMSKEIQTVAPPDLGTPHELEAMRFYASMAASSGFLQSSTQGANSIQRTADAFWVIALGRSLGMSPMTALSTIYVVSRKPTLSGQGMLSVLYRSGCKVRLPDPANVKDSATVAIQRPGDDGWQEATFNMDMANKAGINKGFGWQKYPQQMLIWRAVSMCARLAAPDVIGGMYLTEEISDAPVDEDGAIIDAVDMVIDEPVIKWPSMSMVYTVLELLTKEGVSEDDVILLVSFDDLSDMSSSGWGQYETGKAAFEAIKQAHANSHQSDNEPTIEDFPPATKNFKEQPKPSFWKDKKKVETFVAMAQAFIENPADALIAINHVSGDVANSYSDLEDLGVEPHEALAYLVVYDHEINPDAGNLRFELLEDVEAWKQRPQAFKDAVIQKANEIMEETA